MNVMDKPIPKKKKGKKIKPIDDLLNENKHKNGIVNYYSLYSF